MLETIFKLLILFQLKHFLCDYPLQGAYMLGKFKDYPDFILPLLSHSAVQGIGTLAIFLLFAPQLWWIALIDIVIHFIIDRLKANKKLLGRWKPDQPYFWWALGFDQMVHHLTHYLYIWIIIQN